MSSVRQGQGCSSPNGVGAERVAVVLVRIAGEDAVERGAHHLQKRVPDAFRIPGTIEGIGEGPVRPIR
jgi:hypothetical protein